MRYYCTYFDRNYLVKAVTLIESLKKHEEEPFTVFAVCLDEISRLVLQKLILPNVVPIGLHEIEQNDYKLQQCKQNRTIVEYYWTLTPSIILKVLDFNSNIDIITYLDADMFFYASSKPVFDEFVDNDVMIHEHRFPDELKHLEANGKYNVGMMCFRNNSNGRKVLRWWRERCIEWCYNRSENGKFGDQGYLNDWLTRFDKVCVLQNVGAALAPWNHIQYIYSKDCNGSLFVNGQKLIFYHFHSIIINWDRLIVPVKHGIYLLNLPILKNIFAPYLHAFSNSIGLIKSVIPDYQYGLNEEIDVNSEIVLISNKKYFSQIREFVSKPDYSLDDTFVILGCGQLLATHSNTSIYEKVSVIKQSYEKGFFSIGKSIVSEILCSPEQAEDIRILSDSLG